MTLITYIRPSGNPITVNDCEETRALAASSGWVLEGQNSEEVSEEESAVVEPKKRGRPRGSVNR